MMDRILYVVISLLAGGFLFACNNEDEIPAVQGGSYSVDVEILSDSYKYSHNIVGFVGTVDWGDGTKSTFDVKTDNPEHMYVTDGIYNVVCKGTATGLSSRNINTHDIVRIRQIGGMGFTSMNAAFFKQTRLEGIPGGCFDECPIVTDFCEAFAAGYDGDFKNMLILSVPEGLFDKCTEVTSFERTFYSCQRLVTIPTGLFDHCTKVTTFNCTFGGCKVLEAIPDGLFDRCTKVTDFGECFMGTAAVKAVPDGLFRNCPEVTSFWNLFGWSGIEAIPEGLFDYNTKVETFETAFSNCDGLTSIPEGLFDNCTKVLNFFETFEDCNFITSVPEGLFDKCTEVLVFKDTFRGCTSLKDVPAGLFDNNLKADNFIGTFRGCTALTGESPYTLIDGVKVHLYERSAYKELFVAPLVFSKCFEGCSGLSDYDAVPDSWK